MAMNVQIDYSACEADKNRGRMVGVALGAGLVAAGHFLLKKQVPAYAVPGSYMAYKAAGAVGAPILMGWFLGESYEKDCRNRYLGMSPPRVTASK